MELDKIIAISGRPGLFEVQVQKPVVVSLPTPLSMVNALPQAYEIR